MTRLLSYTLASLTIAAPLAAQGGGHGAHGAPAAAGERFGRITFPTSARPAARAEFVKGVLYLHNFHYPQALRTFRQARLLDSTDVMSAAFEALAHTHPVWNQQDLPAARAALARLAPTREARAAMARTPRERAWLHAVEELYGGDAPKAARDTAFARAMARLHADAPRDPEAATFHALALLGLNQGVREPAAYAQAEAIADSVLRAHPQHPGALHYRIHAVDDPANAARGLAAARAYGEVAPSAGHALHMTSHIYIARGMWDEVVAANRRAAATTPHVFGHGTHWLVYALLQQGRAHEARAWVDSMLTLQREVHAGATAVRGTGDVNAHAILMTATWVADAEAWDHPLARWRGDTAAVWSEAIAGLNDFMVGWTAARRAARPVDLGAGSRAADRALADSMRARLEARAGRGRALEGPAAQEFRMTGVMAEVLAAELVAGAKPDSAVALLRAAAAHLEAIPYEFGPPTIVKPPRERAAELLLSLDRPAEALAELELAERMAPGRTLARRARARALLALGRRDAMRREYAALAGTLHVAEPTYPWLVEARWGRGDMPEAGTPATVAAARAARADTVTYASGELRLRGIRWRPAGDAARRPALVIMHGSSGCWHPADSDQLGRLFASRGYVAFFPCRRGQGLSEGQGEAIMAQSLREAGGNREAAARRTTELLETTQLADVRASIAWVRTQPGVDASRVGVLGISFGGILTMLAAEDDPTLRVSVPYAPGAMNWEWNAALRERMLAAARRTRVPTLVVQAENDWSTGPARVLPGVMKEAGATGEGRVYPAVGWNASNGHALLMYGIPAWRDEVLAFVDARLQPGGRRVAGR